MNVNIYNTKDYENKHNWTLGQNKPNSNPICQRVKLMQSVYLQRIMKNNAAKGYEKTRPKQTQFPKCQNECNLRYNKGLWQFSALWPPKKQTQTNPISNPTTVFLLITQEIATALRSDDGLVEAVRCIQRGELGDIVVVRGFCYKRRKSMGKVDGPQKVPESVDYNLWCGPAPMEPLMRKNLHYDWHWVWATGCGEIGNNGPHQLDVCRWVLGQAELPKRVMSIGERFGYDDDGETPNTQIAIFDYEPAPIIYEVRGLPTRKGDSNMDIYRAVSTTGVVMRSGRPSPSPNTGVVVQCEDGFSDLTNLVFYDNKGKEIKRFKSSSPGPQASFIKAVRSRKISDIRTDILEGHLSTALCHMGNISHRIGTESSNEQIREVIQGDKDSLEAFERFQVHLAANGVSLKKTPAILGPWLRMNSRKERFIGKFSKRANELVARDYRKPFVVPERV
jgi:hypothetical protein